MPHLKLKNILKKAEWSYSLEDNERILFNDLHDDYDNNGSNT